MTDATNIPNDEEGYVPAFARDRDQDVAGAALSPESLVGSYFRHDDEDGTYSEGIVVMQAWVGPAAPYVTYLVEFYDRGRYYQKLVGLDRMMSESWSFYDTDAWLVQGARRAEGVPEEGGAA